MIQPYLFNSTTTFDYLTFIGSFLGELWLDCPLFFIPPLVQEDIIWGLVA